ncbi:CD5 antigen-like [Pomacea canaliculata]|uniref:CD5 antigen-like n=1 Tax=Pomacea canaliculata TaxID=400727 RepID=UPI000D7309A8|nr:CD5 antigen-like [Pomacea canaliculata]
MRVRQGARWQGFFLVCTIFFLPLSGVDAQGKNELRLADGPNPYEGRMEVFRDGVWLSVCQENVSVTLGNVVCRELGYPAKGAVLYYSNSYGRAPGEILRKYIKCSGQEISLSGCSFSPRDQTCDPLYTLGVSCDTGVSMVQTVRLVNGTSQYEGRVEVFKAGVWGSVTDQNFYLGRPLYNALAANIVCKNLFGSGYGGSVVPKQEATVRFGVARRRPIHVNNARCEGNEQSLLNCSYTAAWIYETLEDSLAVVCKQGTLRI